MLSELVAAVGYQDQTSRMESRSIEESPSQANEGAVKVQEIITEQMVNKESNETPPEDMEFSQDSNTGSENRTSSCIRTNQDKEDYSETEELRKQATGEQPYLTEGEEKMTSPTSMTTPCSSRNCEEDNAKELEEKTPHVVTVDNARAQMKPMPRLKNLRRKLKT